MIASTVRPSIARSNVRRASPPSRASVVARAYKVNLKDIDGKVTTLEVRVDAGGLRGCKLALTRLLRAHAQVGEDQNILEVALESGIENLPHDCKLGVCMNCAARLTSGELDQGVLGC